MINLHALIEGTSAYRSVKGDKAEGRLSHAYLILSRDKDFLDDYLNEFARLIICGNPLPCGVCRACKLMAEGAYPDLRFYPRKTEDGKEANVKVEDVQQIIEETYLKAVEGEKKVFVISHGENLSPVVQNKLLKTLEEPPHNVFILIGATTDFPLLSTVKSRMKRLEIPAFSAQVLYNALKEDCPDSERLKEACALADGTVGKALEIYGNDEVAHISQFVRDLVLNMKKSQNVLDFSQRFTEEKLDFAEFLSVLEVFYRDMLLYFSGGEEKVSNKNNLQTIKSAERYNLGSCIYILEKIAEAQARKKANANATMLVEWLFFQILEGKHKWLKL